MTDYTRQGICKQNSNHYTIKEAFEHPDILSVLLLIFFYYYILHEKKNRIHKEKKFILSHNWRDFSECSFIGNAVSPKRSQES